ncbi:hypothetical protein ACTXT7_003372 [Hymenolepis weldensis]
MVFSSESLSDEEEEDSGPETESLGKRRKNKITKSTTVPEVEYGPVLPAASVSSDCLGSSDLFKL